MNRVTLLILLFLFVGGLMIYQNSKETGESFPRALGSWFLQLGSNAKSVTGYAVKEYDWLPNATTED